MRIAIALVVLLAFAQSPSPQPEAARVLNGHFKAGGPRYEYLPFELSAGTESVTISYSYTGDDGSSVIDLGLFEPGPLTLATPAFRGYSGGAQRTITVGRNHASPGYKTGPLPAGQWHVMLGMYKVAPAGVDVEVRITESREENADDTVPGPNRLRASGASASLAEARETARRAEAEGPGLQTVGGGAARSVGGGAARSVGGGAARSVGGGAARSVGRVLSDPPRWYSGALHLHTTHSDGSIAAAAVSDAARAAGLDFIVITDHNNTTHRREPMPASPLHIVGEEVTTPGGHANVWGLPEGAWIDFRVSPKEPAAADAINSFVAAAHEAGGLFSINHPFGNCSACAWEQTIPVDLDGLEIWNGEKGPQEQAIAMWDRLLRAGRRVTAVGASDWHRVPAPIGSAAVRVFATALTEPAILDGIRQHRVIVMRDARTLPPSVRARCGSAEAEVGGALTCAGDDDLSVRVSMPALSDGNAVFSWNAARMTSRAIGGGTTFTMPAAAGYLRVRIHAADGSTVAITNPIYVSMR